MKSKINWLAGNKSVQTQVEIEEGKTNLLELYRQQKARLPEGCYIEAACGGSGVCGKCKVQIQQGSVPVTAAQRQYLGADEIAAGYRLACQAVVSGDLTVRILQEEQQQIQTPDHTRPVPADGQRPHTQPAYAIAVDLGTTTLAAALIDPEARTVVKQAASVNTQSMYGADVISRIRASNGGERKALQRIICGDLKKLFQTLLTGYEHPRVTSIAIAGNTVMLHLLRGYSCERLGQAPFTPVSLEPECLKYGELFGRDICEASDLDPNEQETVRACGDSSVYLLPGLSAFVGADIAAGLYSSGFWQMPEDELAVFLDLGTNGELAVGNGAGFFSAAAAAGPVFEGGSLSCGMPGVPGAVSNVTYLYHKIRIQTIGGRKPLGICGTGALEAAAALRREGLLDENGLLAPPLFADGMVLGEKPDGGVIRLTQEDIRRIQMAKAAIRAAVETLLLRYQKEKKRSAASPGKIYLAGGFGYYLSGETAAAVGLLPVEWKEKTVVCGNTSLKGAAAYITEPRCAAVLETLREKNHTVSLAEDSYFQEAYIQNMQFPPV